MSMNMQSKQFSPLPPISQLQKTSGEGQMQQQPQYMQDIIAAQTMSQMQSGEQPPAIRLPVQVLKPSIVPMLIAGGGAITGGVLGYFTKNNNQLSKFFKAAGRVAIGGLVGGGIGVAGAFVAARSIAIKQLKAMEQMLAGIQGPSKQISSSIQPPPKR